MDKMSSESHHINFLTITPEWNEHDENHDKELSHLNTEDSNNIYLKPPENNSHATNRSRISTSSKNSIVDFIREFPSNEADFTTTTMKDAFYGIFKPMQQKEKNLTFVEKMRKILHSQILYAFQIILVIFDIICVLAQIVCDIILKDNNPTITSTHSIHLKNGSTLNVDISGFSNDFENFHTNQFVHHFEAIVEICSAVILSIVIFFAILKFIFEFKFFIKSRLEIFDITIVIISFVLEIFIIIEKHSIKEIEAAAVIFRFWRIIRIMNGKVLMNILTN
jgi:hypothetical protein